MLESVQFAGSRSRSHVVWKLRIMLHGMIVNPRTGGGRLSAPSGFSHIAKKTAARSAAKFAIAVQRTI